MSAQKMVQLENLQYMKFGLGKTYIPEIPYTMIMYNIYQTIVKTFFNSLLWIWCQISSEAQQKALPEHRHPAEQIFGQTCWLLGKLANESNGSHLFPFWFHRFIPWTFHIWEVSSYQIHELGAWRRETWSCESIHSTFGPTNESKINPQRNAAVSASLNGYLRQVLLAEPGLLTWHVSLGCNCMERGTGGTGSFGGRRSSTEGWSQSQQRLAEIGFWKKIPKFANQWKRFGGSIS